MAKDIKIHYELKSITPYTQTLTWSVCGLYSFRFGVKDMHIITDDVSKVNCGNCKRTDKYKKQLKES